MFIQIITGTIRDRDAVRRLLDRWDAELRPGATGFLGATIGVTDDGTLVDVARFESRDSAMANSTRPEQDAWWSELEACFDGAPSVRESEDVTVYQHGDLDAARFVQVMEGRVHDVDRARSFMLESEPLLAAERPDLVGDVEILYPDGTYTDIAYFESEAAARAGESKEPSPALRAAMDEMAGLFEVSAYLDLREPMLY
jgi:hypothetical protein